MLTKSKIVGALVKAVNLVVQETIQEKRDRPLPTVHPRLAERLRSYDWIIINSSAGKDSQAMLDYVVSLCDAAGIPRKRIVVAHADLGTMEWQGTKELAKIQAEHYGLRFEVEKRPQGNILDHVRQRRLWPGQTTRYCTSDHKRAQILKVMTRLVNEAGLSGRKTRQCRILNCLGLRAEESAGRRNCSGLPKQGCKKGRVRQGPNKGQLCVKCGGRGEQGCWEHNKLASTKTTRHVDTWLPIQYWKVDQVWDRIKEAGTPYHKAYDLGMPRLSCVFCIFAPRPALILSGKHNRDLLDEYAKVEAEIDHTFTQDITMADIKAAVESGEEVTDIEDWNDYACS
jgi:3'-phosphoadenosine 5'-phosphosulfate sulfotransferase (PAPS reductase)/FAD synthetase